MSTLTRKPQAAAGGGQKQECQLCHKQVATLPNGRLRYHSCQPGEATKPVAEQLPQGYGASADGNPTPRSEAILAQTQGVSTVTTTTEDRPQTPPADGQAPPSEPTEPANQEQPQETTLAGKTVEQATPAKPKREPKPKAPKAEPTASASAIKARLERLAIVDRTKAIAKVTGTGDRARIVGHLFDSEADRTLCGAVVPASDETRAAQHWYAEGLPQDLSKVATTECGTCQARITKLRGEGPARKRPARKASEAEAGKAVEKAKGDTKVVHLLNSKAEPPRTLCGALITEGFSDAAQGTTVSCTTCSQRLAKLSQAATSKQS